MPFRSIAAGLMLAFAGVAAPPAHALPAQQIAGVAVHPWQMRDPETLERTFARIERAGVKLARVDLRWCVVEPHGPALGTGRADWSEMDAIVAAAERHGVKLLPILGSVPPWASPEGEYWSYPNRRPFEDFFS